ncbi:MAG TPA: two-component regulator propeller domain-containing protein, partial [Gemmatimonadaceae bacterium]|nr:two-component regulator propeller domain-containing protein [Gemmatimonadaceae bacterium]
MAITRTAACRIALAWLLCAWSGCAVALDPALDMSQYAHTAWRFRDGFTKGHIRAIAQTPDGYLWLGTDSGLLRFDGVQAVPWRPPAGQQLPDNGVLVLHAARDGTLWIATRRGLAAWDGHRLTTYPRFDGYYIAGIFQDREGTVWVTAQGSLKPGLICAIRAGMSECQGEDGSLGTWTGHAYEDSRGVLWVTSSKGVWRWRPGPPKLYTIPDGAAGTYQPLVEDATGAMLVVNRFQILRFDNDKFDAVLLPAMGRTVQLDNITRDRDGAIWIGTAATGLLHVHGNRVDAFTHSDGLSGDKDVRVFEDREGSIWAVTTEGIDRFRAQASTTYSALQGFSGFICSVETDVDGSIWVGTSAGLYRWHDGRVAAYRPRSHDAPSTARSTPAPYGSLETIEVAGLPAPRAASLFQDRGGRLWLGSSASIGVLDHDRFVSVSESGGYVDSIVQDSDGVLWVARRDAGLQKVSGDRIVQQFAWTGIGPRGPAWRLAIDSVRGGVWLGFFSGGIARVVDGRVRESYSASEGLGRGIVNHVRSERDGTVWIATEGGLSRLKAGHIVTLDSKLGLPCDDVESSAVVDDGSMWLYLQCGMARITRHDLDAWSAAVDSGRPPPSMRTTVLDASDGVRGADHLGTYSPHLVVAGDGKVWFTTVDGVSAIDPHHLLFNDLPPPVHVDRVVADRQVHDAVSPLRLPPLVRDLQVDYTALSLVAPEKNRFRYKLEGHDPDWQDAGDRRQALYADLAPGHYRFRVMASNNSGVWNEQGATLDFSIAPAYWQTTWFRALCVAVLAA